MNVVGIILMVKQNSIPDRMLIQDKNNKPLYLILLLWMSIMHPIVAYTQVKVDNSKDMATVLPVGSFSRDIAETGKKIFVDQGYVFQALPDFLKGLYYIKGSMKQGNTIVPTTHGAIYLLTPLKGQPNSQEETLIKEGFTKTEYPSFSLFKGQQEQIGVFYKKITGKFNRIQYQGWAIAFFSSKALPSITLPAKVTWAPEKQYALDTRKWQGCPSIEKTGKRLWTVWFSGGITEPDKGNYGVVAYSDTDGKKWVDPAMIIEHPDTNVRVMDPQLWKDPKGRLWIFWVQNTGQRGFDGIWGTWAIRMDNPEAENPTWTPPQRLVDGLTRNKITVLSNGDWLLPSYNWINNQSTVYASSDEGKSWKLRGGPMNEGVYFYEHMLLELNSDTLWMLQRRMKESFSMDKGKTWTSLENKSVFTAADSRLYLGRLKSGNLLLVYNHDPERKVRKNMTALLSVDNGKTWPYKLLIDERNATSYPDLVQDKDGLIYLVYDRSRTGEKEILLTTFSEDDIKTGYYQSPRSQQKIVISKAP